MHAFARLYERLDATTSTQAKVGAMVAYFRDAPPEDAAWALFFLTGRRFKRLVPVRSLCAWAMEIAEVPGWLFDECYGSVGDLAELVALLIAELDWDAPEEPIVSITREDPRAVRDLFALEEDDDRNGSTAPIPRPITLAQWAQAVLALRDLPEPVQRARVMTLWKGLDRTELLLVDKMITGELRVGVSQLLVQRAIAEASGVPAPVVAHRMMGTWEPTAELFARIVAPATTHDDPSRPYPFALASPLEEPPETLGPREQWWAEWKWDGIRCQLVRRDGDCWLWSRGEDLVTDRFPEITGAARRALPEGLVLDGEAIAWRGERPLPFSVMQRRIGRKALGPKVLADAPVVFVAYDLLEEGGVDLRERPFRERRAALEAVIARAADPALRLSPSLDPSIDWDALREARARSREAGVEGLMLKHELEPYRAGRRRGGFWKWKIDPFSIDAVLVSAQPGSGRRSNLFTDYTFAVWDGDDLVPFAKAYSGLDDAEVHELDRWVRRHTLGRHGPVRQVEPHHVFELAFEGLAASSRHRSGVAVRFPRIARWRHDKPVREADTLESLQALLRLSLTES